MERVAHESREKTSREKTEKVKVWQPPEVLPAYKDAIPDYHLRWVRYSLQGENQDANVLSRVRQGYEPVRPEELDILNVLTMEDGKHAGTVVSGDLMLMKIPLELKAQRDKYFAGKAKAQQRMADREFEDEDNELMPLSKSVKTQISVGHPQFKEE